MKRLEVINKAFTFTNDNPPQYKNLSFQVQVIRDQFNVLRAEFFIEGQELQAFLDGGMDYDRLAEEKMKWILELNTTPVDSFVLESIQREQDRVGLAVEENKTIAIEQATEAAMRIASEKVEDDVTAAFAQLSEQLVQKDLEISTLQQMIVELTLMLSMIGQPELPTEPDPDPPVDPEPPIDEPPSEIPEEPPVEDPPSDPAPIEPIPEEPTNEEFNPDIPTENSDPIGGEGGE